jgi:exopolysaccharide biosynthesis WecB/TagA/CpsF family protein
MQKASEKGYKIFFLGGKEGIAPKAAENIKKRISNIQIVGTHSGYTIQSDEVVDQINRSGADILFVAMGVPMQEKWIMHNRERLTSGLCLGVGALLDYLSDYKPRAPLLMRRLYIEWLWRVFIEPQRMVKRYLIDGAGFLFYLLFLRIKQIIFGNKSKP